MRYGSGGRRHYRPRPLNGEHWVDEDTTDRLNGKGIIGHNEGIDEELNDFGAHPAGADTKIHFVYSFILLPFFLQMFAIIIKCFFREKESAPS